VDLHLSPSSFDRKSFSSTYSSMRFMPKYRVKEQPLHTNQLVAPHGTKCRAPSRDTQATNLTHLLLPLTPYHVPSLPPHPHLAPSTHIYPQQPNNLCNPLPLLRHQIPSTLWFKFQLIGFRHRNLESQFRDWCGSVIRNSRSDFDYASWRR